MFIFNFYFFSVVSQQFTKLFWVSVSARLSVIKNVLKKVYRGYLTTETKHSCRFVHCIVNKQKKKAYCLMKRNSGEDQKTPNTLASWFCNSFQIIIFISKDSFKLFNLP